MSEEAIEVARRFADAFNLGLDEFVACHAEDVVHVTAPEWPEAGTYQGREAVRGLWASIFAVQGQQVEVDEIIPLDESRVLSRLRLLTRGTSSGASVATPIYCVGTAREGLVSRIEYYMSFEEAREAAGLSG